MTGKKPDLPEIATTNQMLKIAREESVKDLPKTIKKLVSSGVAAASAEEICGILAGEHSVSALHLATQKAEQTGAQQAATVLSGPNSTWLMTGGEQDAVTLKVVDQGELLALVEQWTGLARN
jgi:hypothetical protein